MQFLNWYRVAIGSAIEPHFVDFYGSHVAAIQVAIGSAIEPHFVNFAMDQSNHVVAIGSAIEPHFVFLPTGVISELLSQLALQ